MTTTTPDSEVGDGSAKRERSTIRFPYLDLREAASLAATVKNTFGTEATVNQAAAAVGQNPASGSFRTKLATAQTFGVLTNRRGRLALTELGLRLVDDRTAIAAKAEAFLGVPLYQALYEKYEGMTLPEGKGLEAEIRGLGVVESQVERARQVFLRSAEQAGFFWAGSTRLVMPAMAGGSHSFDESAPEKSSPESSNGDTPTKADHPLLQALWGTLPPEPPFSAEDRRRFFVTLAFNIDYVYGSPTDGSFDPEAMASLWRLHVDQPVEKTKVTRPAPELKRQEPSPAQSDPWANPRGGADDEPPF